MLPTQGTGTYNYRFIKFVHRAIHCSLSIISMAWDACFYHMVYQITLRVRGLNMIILTVQRICLSHKAVIQPDCFLVSVCVQHITSYYYI